MKSFEFTPEGVQDCSVTAWVHHNNESTEIVQKLHPAIIICPGGAYEFVSDREAEPVGKPYFAAGYNVFILRYSVGEKAAGFNPLCQLAATIAHIRKYSTQYVTAENEIAVCGFSAGGHLAASLGTLFNEEKFLQVFNRNDNIRPDAMVLCYALITADEYTHESSIEKVSGAKKGSADYEWFGLDKHVDENTPPAFLWHTAADQLVPVENCLKMAMALSAKDVPYELHILPEGEHGLSVCTNEVATPDDYNGRWVEWSIAWMNKLFSFHA